MRHACALLGIPFATVVEAVRRSNVETGGRLLEFGGSEYMIRGRGYLDDPRELEEAVVMGGGNSQIVRVKDIGKVTVGPEMRRGVADLDGRGETVSGIVVMRQGANVVDVIDRVKRKLKQIAPGLPPGVRVVPGLRPLRTGPSGHRQRCVATLIEIILTVVLVILLFLWHPPSAAIPILTIPLTVLAVAVPFHLMGLSFNVMSLGGIAIAAGALVDAAIVVVEQTHKKLEEWQPEGGRGGAESVPVPGADGSTRTCTRCSSESANSFETHLDRAKCQMRKAWSCCARRSPEAPELQAYRSSIRSARNSDPGVTPVTAT